MSISVCSITTKTKVLSTGRLVFGANGNAAVALFNYSIQLTFQADMLSRMDNGEEEAACCSVRICRSFVCRASNLRRGRSGLPAREDLKARL